MLGFRKLFAETLVYCPRRSSRLIKNIEYTSFGQHKITQNFWTEVSDADSSHLQSTCVDWKIMTWTFFVWSMGVL